MAKVSTNEGSLMRRGGNPSRDVPAEVNGRPPSPKAVERIYSQGKQFPNMGSKTDEAYDNQFTENKKAKGYCPEVPKGEWRRGGDLGGSGRPGFDRGKFDISNKPDRRAPGGRPNTASGQDAERSPLSAARKTWSLPPTLNKKDWG
jgi:hypothetical protein